ncbi:uncharacterized protein PFL1_05098 [Pseudozyma flocculosa PF-1]|uniref:Uncharacterized protein n=2 Tax=Pseudozyma flocculosa TaxID=84751 RepID=A0A5C3F6A3_9BASI|nr:uncharacterized protein PFL1_05098 [Pseudozyma flocculosa PF-1]EPQ27176.1 hypothetical protein PFL1_05098 [Pseudozyma flocculosa PF-1]SPO39536.1 uncharacterized protein PSFLO_05017 [Pseudozyma flocculosa]
MTSNDDVDMQDVPPERQPLSSPTSTASTADSALVSEGFRRACAKLLDSPRSLMTLQITALRKILAADPADDPAMLQEHQQLLHADISVWLREMHSYEKFVKQAPPLEFSRRLIDSDGNPIKVLSNKGELFRRFYQRWSKSEDLEPVALLDWMLVHGTQVPQRVGPPVLSGAEAVPFWQLAASFNEPYLGDQVRWAEHLIRVEYGARYREARATGDKRNYYYSKTLPIVQSSGTGKSRLVWELRHCWPSLSLTLRRSGNDAVPTSGYPLQDNAAKDYFSQSGTVDPDLIVIAFIAAWLKQAAITVHVGADSMAGLFATWDYSVRETSTKKWIPNQQRHDAFEAVARRARANVTRYRDEVLRGCVPKTEDAMPEFKHDEIIGRAEEMVRLLIKPALQDLSDKLLEAPVVKAAQRKFDLERPLLLLAIDECTLLEQLTSKAMLLHLRRCFSMIDDIASPDLDVWLLLLDTSSSVGQMVPSEKHKKSSREQEMLSFSPLIPVGFDVFVDPSHHPARPADALRLDALKRYGRALWHQYGANRLVTVASMKLCGEVDANKVSPELRAITLLSHRVCLEVLPIRSSLGSWLLPTALVDKHLRWILSFVDDDTIYTRALSEPALALAAWYRLTDDGGGETPEAWTYSDVVLTMSQRLINASPVDIKGANGEFLVRLLLTMARDASEEVERARALRILSLLQSVPAVSASSFLSGLLGHERGSSALAQLEQAIDLRRHGGGLANLGRSWSHWQQDATKQQRDEQRGTGTDKGEGGSRSSQGDGSGPAEPKRGAWLNFTHMAVLVCELQLISRQYLWKCWKRGVALQCHSSQRGIDGILPVFLGSLDEKLDEREAAARMTYIGWQAKNQADACATRACFHGPLHALSPTPQQGTLEEPPPPPPPPTREGDPPLFTLVFELGTSAEFRDSSISKHVKVVNEACAKAACGGVKCLTLRIRGCDAAVYPFLERWRVTAPFVAMVEKRDLLPDDWAREQVGQNPGDDGREGDVIPPLVDAEALP